MDERMEEVVFVDIGSLRGHEEVIPDNLAKRRRSFFQGILQADNR